MPGKKKAACLSLSLQSAGSNISVLQPLKPSLSLFDIIAQMKLHFVVAQGLKRLACASLVRNKKLQPENSDESGLQTEREMVLPSAGCALHSCLVLFRPLMDGRYELWTTIRFVNQPVSVLLWVRVTH